MKIRLLLLTLAVIAGLWALEIGVDFGLSRTGACPAFLQFKTDYRPFFLLGDCLLAALVASLIFFGAGARPAMPVRRLDAAGQRPPGQEDQWQRIIRRLLTTNDALNASQAATPAAPAPGRTVADNIPGVIFELRVQPDGAWSFLFVSEKCRDMIGVEAAAIQADAEVLLNFVHPDDIGALQAGFAEAVRQLQPWSGEARFLVCGTCKWLKSIARPERQPDGSTLFDGVIIDITDLKRTEQELRQSRQMLQLVLDTIPSAVFWKDRDSVYLGGNRVFARDAGLAGTADAAHKTDLDFVWREQAAKYRAGDRQVMETNTPQLGFEEPLLNVAQSRRTVRTNKVPLRDEAGKVIGILGTYEDITERKQAEELVRAALREKEVLLKEIHHRVKNNLQIISSLLSLQSQRIADPRDLDLFQESQTRVRTMALIHENLYQADDLAQTDFAAYLRSLAGELQRAYQVQSVRIAVAADDGIRLGIDAAIPCALIVHELVTNAFKYAFVAAARGGAERRAQADEIRIDLRREPGGGLRLAVSDNGIGLPERFGQDKTRALGWHLIKALVNQLHGRLEIARQNGTTVRIYLPGA